MSTPAAPSFVRTLVPVAVGQIAAYLATIGITLPDEVVAAVTVVIGFIITAVYYAALRFLEQKWPWIGVLLGWAATPDGYTPASERDLVKVENIGRKDLEALAATEVDMTPPAEDYRPRH